MWLLTPGPLGPFLEMLTKSDAILAAKSRNSLQVHLNFEVERPVVALLPGLPEDNTQPPSVAIGRIFAI